MQISLLPFLLRDRGSHGRANRHKNRFYAKSVQRLIIWPHLSKTTEWLLELWWYSLKLICFTIFFPSNSICFRQKQNHLITVTQTERDSNFHFSGRIFRPLRSVFASANLEQKGTGIDSTNSLKPWYFCNTWFSSWVTIVTDSNYCNTDDPVVFIQMIVQIRNFCYHIKISLTGCERSSCVEK